MNTLTACVQAVELLLSSRDENEDEEELQARVAAHLYFTATLWGMLVGGRRNCFREPRINLTG